MSKQINHMSRQEQSIKDFMNNCLVMSQVPIVAMTANAFAEDVHAAKTVGMNAHIAKPLELNTLAKILKKWIL